MEIGIKNIDQQKIVDVKIPVLFFSDMHIK